MIAKFIKSFIPKKQKYLLNASREYWYDIKRFVKHSNAYYKFNTQEKADGYLTLNYHVIEKGLTMPETRLGFGKQVVTELIEICRSYHHKKFDPNSLPYRHTIMVLREYIKFHEAHKFELDTDIVSGIHEISAMAGITESSAQMQFVNSDYFAASKAPFNEFCRSRFTARNFTSRPIPLDTLYKSIELAIESPSACNRQPNRVYIVNDTETIASVLKLQSGNRGFGNLAQTLLIVTSDVSVFQSHKERNEPAFNAGLFSMTLAYALHYYEIGSCMLNWSSSKENDSQLRKILGVPENEKITIVIACGYLPNDFKIAKSPRLAAEYITTVVNKKQS